MVEELDLEISKKMTQGRDSAAKKSVATHPKFLRAPFLCNLIFAPL